MMSVHHGNPVFFRCDLPAFEILCHTYQCGYSLVIIPAGVDSLGKKMEMIRNDGMVN